MRNVNRSAYLDPEHRFSIAESGIPEPAEDQVLVEIKANGICGSDIHYFHEGRLGNFVVSRPYIPGHEASGVVADMGINVKGLSKGDHVVIEPGIPCGKCAECRIGRYNLCGDVEFLSAPPTDGTFRDYICIRADCVFQIPERLSLEEAALVEPVSVAVHAVNRSRFRNGESAAVFGAGPIGLITLQAFKAAGGGKVVCIDKLERRLDMAKRLGADDTVNVTDAAGRLEGIADIVFETAGSSAATSQLFHAARAGGRVVQVGWPDRNVVGMDIASFIEKELDYISVNRYANAYPAAIEWVSSGRINVKDLITHRFALDDIEEAFRFTLEYSSEVIKTVVLNDWMR